MKFPVHVGRICFSIVVLFSLQTQADNETYSNYNSEETFRNYNNAIWAAVGANSLGYKEPAAAPYLSDSERDWIPSGALGLSFMQGDADIYFSLEGAVTYGDAHYNGAYLYYPTTPLQGTTRETITEVDGKIGKGIALGSSVMFIPYIDLGYRYWDRNLGGGDKEDYHNLDALGGLMVQGALTNDLMLSGYGSVGSTLAPRMNTNGNTYDLGSKAIYKVGGKIGYEITQSIELFTTLDYEHFSFGQSSVQADDTYEPDSNTNETSVRVGAAYHFGR